MALLSILTKINLIGFFCFLLWIYPYMVADTPENLSWTSHCASLGRLKHVTTYGVLMSLVASHNNAAASSLLFIMMMLRNFLTRCIAFRCGNLQWTWKQDSTCDRDVSGVSLFFLEMIFERQLQEIEKKKAVSAVRVILPPPPVGRFISNVSPLNCI